MDPSSCLFHRSAGQGPLIVAVHGFTQTGDSWGPFGNALAHLHELIKVDAPGHGHSSEVVAGVPAAASLVVRCAPPGTFTLLGYSMGARIALRTALDHPERVEKLVLLSGSPGIADPAERQARRTADEALADSIGDVGEFVDRWLARPLFAGLPTDRAERESRGENTAEGLRSSLRLCGTGAMEPVWNRLGELTVPVLLLTGGEDGKFCAIAGQMADAIGPNASVIAIPGAGHAVHLERPEESAAAVIDFLAQGR